jgi:AAA ATPase-like protein
VYGNPGLQDTLVETIRERGAQSLIFGDTGVGKSSLVRYAAEDASASMLIVECRSGRTFDQHCEDALRQLVDFEEVEVVDEQSSEREGEAGVSKIIALKGALRRQDGTTSRFEAIRRTALDALFQAMEENGVQLAVFDNFQNVDDDERARFGQAMEMLSDRADATRNIKIVVVGIAEDAPSLLGSSGSVRRRTVEIGVPRMPDDEIREIFVNGFRLLNIRADARRRMELSFSTPTVFPISPIS